MFPSMTLVCARFSNRLKAAAWRCVSAPRRCLRASSCRMKSTPCRLKGRSTAEQRWLLRQHNDPYVKAAQLQNFRCRSAFKLLQIDDRFRLLQPGHRVLDCGAAPGAWSQVAVQRVNSAGTDQESPRGTVIGVDLLHIAPLDGAHFLSCYDVTDPATHAKLTELLPGAQADVILSDMAPNASGFHEMDHEKLVTMCLALMDLAEKVLRPGGSLVCKCWDGILAPKLQQKLSAVFRSVTPFKPDASRKDSAERFFLAKMYRKALK
ncbi:rRNA methyltransferase 2, mitochondrial [Thalassophryne amazonica]|uniref:rRNA methyltransferase 2, mitochondrial n=1 Tax=Thalassophryne amazonica TaxID=390379 RepID=UPI001471D5FD|nr:rRNA methyltransferase 2, mitochondrial [Thalassophryne amazonica]